MALILYATLADLKLALRVGEGEFKVGTTAGENLWEDARSDGVGGVGTLTSAGATWIANDLIGAWLQDSAGKVFKVNSNSGTVLTVSVCLSDGTSTTPASGAFIVSKLGYYLGTAIGRVTSALAAVYYLPLAGTGYGVADILREITVNVAAYNVFAHSYRNSSPQGGGTIPEIIRDQFKDAKEQLAEILSLHFILKGERRIGGPAIALPRYTKADRQFATMETLDQILDDVEGASDESSLGGIPSI